MVAYSFKAQFAEKVASGEKRQTIRAERKDHRRPRAGDLLQLYTGMRTKACRKLRVAACVDVREIKIEEPMPGAAAGPIFIDGLNIDKRAKDALAKADGFDRIGDMIAFFRETHGLPFRGVVINW